MIGERIRKLREEKGMSQAELATGLGCSRMTINNYETEKRIPDIEFAMSLANYFNVTVEYLSGRTEFRNREEVAVSVKKAEQLVRILEELPQGESQRMLLYFQEVLEKAIDNELETSTIFSLSNCFIQLRKVLGGYENLQKSIVPPIVELRRRKVPESQIRLAVRDKEDAIYQYSFEAMQAFTDVLKSFTDEMKKGLEKSMGEALNEKLG
jgi:transcriptional regulator with XRE-family HTH domain